VELIKRDFSLGKFEFCKGCAVGFETWLKSAGNYNDVGGVTGIRSSVVGNKDKVRDFLGELDAFLGVKKK